MKSPIIKVLELKALEYYITHLSIINCLLPVKMTNNEIRILAGFMCYRGELANKKFGSTGRKLIREALNLSHAGLSNYIGSLLKKGCLIDNDGELTILPILQPDDLEQRYLIKVKNVV